MITSSRYPTVSSSLSWLTPSISSSDSTARSISYNCSSNESPNSRTGYIYLSYNGNNAGSITVIQAGKPEEHYTQDYAINFYAYNYSQYSGDLYGNMSVTIGDKTVSYGFVATWDSDDYYEQTITVEGQMSDHTVSFSGTAALDFSSGTHNISIITEPAYGNKQYNGITSGLEYTFSGSGKTDSGNITITITSL